MSGFDFDDDDDVPMAPGLPAVERRVTRSAADDIIDAVQGVRKPAKITGCPVCGSSNVAYRGGGLNGGTKVLKCREKNCRVEIPIATTQPAAAILGPTRAQSGPFYGPPKAPPSKNEPPHRRALAIHEAKKK